MTKSGMKKNVDEIVEIFCKCHKPIKVRNNSDYHFGTSGETYGVGFVAKIQR